MVLEIVNLIKEGKLFREIYEILFIFREKIDLFFILDILEYF